MDSSDEINIWEEPEDCPENILLPSDLEGGLVAAATLNKLVEKLTSADENGTESSECKFGFIPMKQLKNQRFEFHENIPADVSKFYTTTNISAKIDRALPRPSIKMQIY
jgi:hypothetical protein